MNVAGPIRRANLLCVWTHPGPPRGHAFPGRSHSELPLGCLSFSWYNESCFATACICEVRRDEKHDSRFSVTFANPEGFATTRNETKGMAVGFTVTPARGAPSEFKATARLRDELGNLLLDKSFDAKHVPLAAELTLPQLGEDHACRVVVKPRCDRLHGPLLGSTTTRLQSYRRHGKRETAVAGDEGKLHLVLSGACC